MSELFNVERNTLEDNSETFDVVSNPIFNAEGVVWNAPSENTAYMTKEALNDVLNAFTRTGSDREACELAEKIRNALLN